MRGDNEVQYIVRLHVPEHLEHVKIIQRLRGGKALAEVSRFLQHLCVVEVSPSQVRKIEKRTGRLSITNKMVDRGRARRNPHTGEITW